VSADSALSVCSLIVFTVLSNNWTRLYDLLHSLHPLPFSDVCLHVLACSRTSLQKALFSATVPDKTLEVVNSIMDNAVHITIGARLATASNIDQKLVYCGNEEGKLVAIRTLLQTSCRPPVLVFVQSKERAQEL
jgi:superfamily II DNA/RNA helicase